MICLQALYYPFWCLPLPCMCTITLCHVIKWIILILMYTPVSNILKANIINRIHIFFLLISLRFFKMKSKTFCRVVKKKSTENYKGAPYITTFLCTSLWTSYGVLKPGGFQIAIVNGAGAVFHCTYIILFLVYSPQDQKVIN